MIIPTPRSRQAIARRLKRLNHRIEEVIADMAMGVTLHRGLDRRKRVQWMLSDGEIIDDEIARLVINHSDIAGVGDTLFPEFGELSQTFHYIGD
jgi:hypothetical protein